MLDESEVVTDDVPLSRLEGRRAAFLGRLGGMNRREAQVLLRQHGAVVVGLEDPHVDLVVLGAEQLPLDI